MENHTKMAVVRTDRQVAWRCLASMLTIRRTHGNHSVSQVFKLKVTIWRRVCTSCPGDASISVASQVPVRSRLLVSPEHVNIFVVVVNMSLSQWQVLRRFTVFCGTRTGGYVNATMLMMDPLPLSCCCRNSSFQSEENAEWTDSCWHLAWWMSSKFTEEGSNQGQWWCHHKTCLGPRRPSLSLSSEEGNRTTCMCESSRKSLEFWNLNWGVHWLEEPHRVSQVCCQGVIMNKELPFFCGDTDTAGVTWPQTSFLLWRFLIEWNDLEVSVLTVWTGSSEERCVTASSLMSLSRGHTGSSLAKGKEPMPSHDSSQQQH